MPPATLNYAIMLLTLEEMCLFKISHVLEQMESFPVFEKLEVVCSFSIVP